MLHGWATKRDTAQTRWEWKDRHMRLPSDLYTYVHMGIHTHIVHKYKGWKIKKLLVSKSSAIHWLTLVFSAFHFHIWWHCSYISNNALLLPIVKGLRCSDLEKSGEMHAATVFIISPKHFHLSNGVHLSGRRFIQLWCECHKTMTESMSWVLELAWSWVCMSTGEQHWERVVSALDFKHPPAMCVYVCACECICPSCVSVQVLMCGCMNVEVREQSRLLVFPFHFA